MSFREWCEGQRFWPFQREYLKIVMWTISFRDSWKEKCLVMCWTRIPFFKQWPVNPPGTCSASDATKIEQNCCRLSVPTLHLKPVCSLYSFFLQLESFVFIFMSLRLTKCGKDDFINAKVVLFHAIHLKKLVDKPDSPPHHPPYQDAQVQVSDNKFGCCTWKTGIIEGMSNLLCF